MAPKNFMTVQEFLAEFRIGKTTFYREVSAKRLAVVKIGRATRVVRAEAEAWRDKLLSDEIDPRRRHLQGPL